ncbi:uncharacterized protein TNCV_3340311 [Trichonephila clavipes]|nr:uncharacterized protein TNCV_3340311 [Trichonephila clavipes]
MFDPSSFVNPTPLADADTSRDVLPRGGTSQWRPTRFNLYDPEMRNARGFNVWPELYFSGSENVTEFLEGIDNQITLLEIPSDLSCAYLKGHLLGRALDWYQIFGSALVQNTTTDFVAAVTEWYRYRTVACFVTGSSPVPLKTRRVGQRGTLNLSRAETSSRGVVW